MERQIALANHDDQKTVEGLLLVEPNRGVKQKFEGLYEALTKKHAIGYAKLLKQYEEARAFSCHHHHHIRMHNALETNHDDVLVIKPTDQSCHHEERIHHTLTRGWSSVSALGNALSRRGGCPWAGMLACSVARAFAGSLLEQRGNGGAC